MRSKPSDHEGICFVDVGTSNRAGQLVSHRLGLPPFFGGGGRSGAPCAAIGQPRERKLECRGRAVALRLPGSFQKMTLESRLVPATDL
jgi:hypothetical protein